MTASPAPGDPIRVFVLDDHEVVRRGLQDLLESDGDIRWSVSPDSPRKRPAAFPPCGPTSHCSMPGYRTGRVSTCAARSAPVTRRSAVLILTSYDDDEALFAAIMAGAAGYLLKQMGGTDLVDAVRRVASGQSLLDPAVTRQVLDRLRQGPPVDQALAPLTAQERRILELIGEGLTNRQIGERMYLAEKTVKNYVSSRAGQARVGTPYPGRGVRDQAPALSPAPTATHSR